MLIWSYDRFSDTNEYEYEYEYCITSLSAQSWQYRDRRKPEAGTMPYSYFEWLQGFFIVHSTIGRTVHSRPLNSLEHCICTTTMTNIRPDRDSNLVPPDLYFIYYLAFDQYIYIFRNRYKKYIHIISLNCIYNIGRAALEQAYRSLCKLGSNYIYFNLCTKSISIKV